MGYSVAYLWRHVNLSVTRKAMHQANLQSDNVIYINKSQWVGQAKKQNLLKWP